jgi:hypothetical protein
MAKPMSSKGFPAATPPWRARRFRWLSIDFDVFRGSTATATATGKRTDGASRLPVWRYALSPRIARCHGGTAGGTGAPHRRGLAALPDDHLAQAARHRFGWSEGHHDCQFIAA